MGLARGKKMFCESWSNCRECSVGTGGLVGYTKVEEESQRELDRKQRE